MAENKPYLTIGQMAKLHYINRKTLLFYDQTGLFSPALTGENGYRYYSYSQCPQLEKILFLRRLGVSLEDIRHQIKTAGASDTLTFLSGQREKNREHILRLKEYDRVLRRKEEELREALSTPPGKIELCDLPKQKYLISLPGEGDSEMYHFFSDTLFQAGIQHLYYYSFGAILDLENLLADRIIRNRYFVVWQPEMKHVRPTIRPAGTYLRCYWQGGEDHFDEAYRQLKAYAKEHRLAFTGDAFERQLISDFCTCSPAEFLTEISVPVEQMT